MKQAFHLNLLVVCFEEQTKSYIFKTNIQIMNCVKQLINEIVFFYHITTYLHLLHWPPGREAQIVRFTWPTWGPPASCWPQVGPMLAPWTLPSGGFMVSGWISIHILTRFTCAFSSELLHCIISYCRYGFAGSLYSLDHLMVMLQWFHFSYRHLICPEVSWHFHPSIAVFW